MDLAGKIFAALLAVTIGVLGAVAVFWVLNKLVELLPSKWERRLKPYAYLLPAVSLIGVILLYPAVTTVYASTLNDDSTRFVGLRNYVRLFGDDTFVSALVNNLLWIIVVPAVVVAIGLLVAVLADRMRPGREKLAKSIIFLPMAISMVGASTIWRLMYAYSPELDQQIGLFNGIAVALGSQPQAWLQIQDFRLNTFLLMVAYIWTQVGYAMVLLSAAIKGVPQDTIEAARVDGASELGIFFRVVVPQAWSTVIVVFVTVLIGVMKVFDIVYAMTNGQFDTDVIGNAFFNAMFFAADRGTASAIVVILMIAVIPVMIYQVRQFRLQEANR